MWTARMVLVVHISGMTNTVLAIHNANRCRPATDIYMPATGRRRLDSMAPPSGAIRYRKSWEGRWGLRQSDPSGWIYPISEKTKKCITIWHREDGNVKKVQPHTFYHGKVEEWGLPTKVVKHHECCDGE